jgi:flagellar biosynthesis component FlhA
MRENKFPASQVHAPRGEVLDLPFVNKKFRNMKQDRNGMKIVYTDIMRLEIGPSLIPLCDEKFNLVQKIGTMRKNREKESGISIPSIYIIDRKVKHKIKGKEVKDLVFGVPAI